MNAAHAHLLMLAPGPWLQALTAELGAPRGPFQVTTALPRDGAVACASARPDAVILGCYRWPDAKLAQAVVAMAAPAPVMLVLPPAPWAAPGDLHGMVGCMPADGHLVRAVAAMLEPIHGVDEQRLLADVLARADEALVIVGPNTRIVTANARFAQMVGRAITTLVDMDVRELMPGALGARFEEVIGGPWRMSGVSFRRADGDLQSGLDVSASVIRRRAGRCTWLVRCFERPSAPDLPPTALCAIERIARHAREAGLPGSDIQLRVIELDRARVSLGREWPRFQHHIGLVCESAIAHELASSDVFLETHRGDYVICFATADAAEADRRTARLQRRLDARLFGEAAIASGDRRGKRG